MKKASWLLLITLILALALAVTTSASAAANFEIKNLTISPDSVKEGQNVTITAVVTNKGDAEGTYNLELKINNESKSTKEVPLAAGKSQTVSFEVTGLKADYYRVELNGLTGDFNVNASSMFASFPPYLWAIVGAIIGVMVLFIIVIIAIPPRKKKAGAAPKAGRTRRQAPSASEPMSEAPMPVPTPMPTQMPDQTPMATFDTMPTPTPPLSPYMQPATPYTQPGVSYTPPMAPFTPPTGKAIFFVSNLTISPNQVKEGEPITISAMVSNNGAAAGKYSLVLRISGVVESITELNLYPGTNQFATFTIIEDTPGDYYAEVDGLSGMFTVIPLIPAHFSVSNLVIAPEHVKQGDSVMISATVTNSGEVSGPYSVVLKLKGAVEAIEEVNVGPGGSQRVTFNINKDTPGFYQVDLEGLTGRFVVEMDWKE